MDLVTTVRVHNEGITLLAEANTTEVYSQQIVISSLSREKTFMDSALGFPKNY